MLKKLIKINPFLNDKKPVEADLLSFVSHGLAFNEEVVQKLCPSAIPFSDFNAKSLYVPSREVPRSPRQPRRLDPLPQAITLPQARWEHARRIEVQKPIAIEPARFRPTPSLFHMTEIDEMDRRRNEGEIVEDLETLTPRSDSTDETHETASTFRRHQDPIEKQARKLAEKDFAQMEANWDKYMFEHMDEATAKFIILRHVHDGQINDQINVKFKKISLFFRSKTSTTSRIFEKDVSFNKITSSK